MVLKGQFLERPALIRVGQIVLDGLAHRGQRTPPLLILSPLSNEGGGMEHVVATELAWAAASASHATLRFNYRGIGASQGKASAKTHAADARAALALLRESTASAAPAVVSIGGSSAILAELAQSDSVGGLAAVSPVKIDVEAVKNWGPRPLVIVADYDLRLPRATLARSISEMGGRLEVVAGADSHFTKNLSQVGKLVADWLERLG